MRSDAQHLTPARHTPANGAPSGRTVYPPGMPHGHPNPRTPLSSWHSRSRPSCEHWKMSQDADALERAITLACWAHRGQRYPSPEAEPYILHPLRVMLAVQGSRAQMAAVLHDVIEDTEVGPGRLREADLPEDVVATVVALTHRPDESYEQYIEKVACDDLAREVKLADLADNLANNRRLASTPDVAVRIDRYEQAVRRLQSPLRRTPQRARPDSALG
jgi:(p)ppGpp synthase/HD superfamily hydrolase